jgi:hypothetical protein
LFTLFKAHCSIAECMQGKYEWHNCLTISLTLSATNFVIVNTSL